MQRASKEVLDALKEFDSATVFNAVVEGMGATQGGRELEGKGGQPENYTGPEIKCLLPELGRAVGYVVTCELTTNDPDSVAMSWDEYYDMLERSPDPIIAVIKDVDSRPGRGGAFGDGMAAMHKMLGVTGVVVDGSVRDVAGINAVGLPIWATGTVPGHGVFTLVRVNSSITVGRLQIHPGELMVADTDGCTKVPAGFDLDVLLKKAREIRARENKLHALFQEPGANLARC